MGVVYRAQQLDADREVAIKLLNSESLDDESTARFYREFKLLSRLTHPNIVIVYGLALDDDKRPYAISEFVEGSTLRSLLSKQGRLTWELAASIVSQLCGALEYVHKEDIVHRDLKPENIMLVDKPHPFFVKLLDFGVARLTTSTQSSSQKLTWTGQLLGSPQYMSPEQVEGRVDARSDIYALACIFYELIAGEPLFNADTAMGMVFKQKSEDPTSRIRAMQKLAPFKLRAILLKALSKNPEDRFQTMDELAAEIRDLQLSPGGYEEQAQSHSKAPSLKLLTLLACVFVIAFGAFFYQKNKGAGMGSKQVSSKKKDPAVLKDLYAQLRAEPDAAKRFVRLNELASLSKNTNSVELRMEVLNELASLAAAEAALPYALEMEETLKTSGQKLSKKSRQDWTLRTIYELCQAHLGRNDATKTLELLKEKRSWILANDGTGECAAHMLVAKVKAYKQLSRIEGVYACVDEFRKMLKETWGFPVKGSSEIFVYAIGANLDLNGSSEKRKEIIDDFLQVLAKTEPSYGIIRCAHDSVSIASDLVSHGREDEAKSLIHNARTLIESREAMLRGDFELFSVYCRLLSIEKSYNPSLRKPRVLSAAETDFLEKDKLEGQLTDQTKNLARVIYNFDGERAANVILQAAKERLSEKQALEACSNLSPCSFLMDEIVESLTLNFPEVERISFENAFIQAAKSQVEPKCQLRASELLEWNISHLLEYRRPGEARRLCRELLANWQEKNLYGTEALSRVLFATIRVTRDNTSNIELSYFRKLQDLILKQMHELSYSLDAERGFEFAVALNRLVFCLTEYDLFEEPRDLRIKGKAFLKKHGVLTDEAELVLMQGEAETFRVSEGKKHVQEFKDFTKRFVDFSKTLSFSKKGTVDDFFSVVLGFYRRFPYLGLTEEPFSFYDDLRKATSVQSAKNPAIELAIIDCFSDFVDETPTKVTAPDKLATDYLRALTANLEAHRSTQASIGLAVLRISMILAGNKKEAEAVAFMQNVRLVFEKTDNFTDENRLEWLCYCLELCQATHSSKDQDLALQGLKELAAKKDTNDIVRASALYLVARTLDGRNQRRAAMEQALLACKLFSTVGDTDRDGRRYKAFCLLSSLYTGSHEPNRSRQALLVCLRLSDRFRPGDTDNIAFIASYVARHFEAAGFPEKVAQTNSHKRDSEYLQRLLSR